MNKKELRYYLFSAFSNIIFLFSAGAIIQTFLSYIGLTPMQIGKYSFCISAVQVITFIISFLYADKIKNIPLTIGIFTLPSILFFAVMIYLSLNDKIDVEIVFITSIIACIFLNLFWGLKSILEYKLPYYIADISEYPRISNTSGIILSVLGTSVSGAFVFLSHIFVYGKVIIIAFVISAMFAAAAFYTIFSLENVNTASASEENKKIGFVLFGLRATKWFILPNILRGLSNGIMGMTAIIMLSTVSSDKSLSSSITTVGTAATILGCFFYKNVYKRINTADLLLMGGTIQFVSLMFILRGNSAFFITMFFIAYFGEVIVDYAVPVYTTQIIPYEYIGGYTAVRMMFFTAGVALGGYVAGIMTVDKPFLLILICAVSQIIHVISYVLYDIIFKKP